MNVTLKINPQKLPVPLLPPTKTVRSVERPDNVYEADKQKMKERRLRAVESTRKTYAQKSAYTVEQETMIIDLYKMGVCTGDIAERVGKSKTAVKQKIEKLRKIYGIEREAPLQRNYVHHKPESEIVRRNHYTPAQDAVIREMKSQGKTFREIADQIGKSKEAVRCRWYRMIGAK